MSALTETLAGRRKSAQSALQKRSIGMNKKYGLGSFAPVPKRKNPYVSPKPGGGSSPTPGPATAPPANANLAGVAQQQRDILNKKPVSLDMEISYESDPVLARIKALGSQNVANAKSEAVALRKQAVLDTGLADVGQEIGLDSATVEAARLNPFSTSREIERSSAEAGRDLDESLNQQNLFYSGARVGKISDLALNTTRARTKLSGDLRLALAGIDSGVLSAEQAAAREEADVLEQVAAAERERAFQEQYLRILAGGQAPDSEYEVDQFSPMQTEPVTVEPMQTEPVTVEPPLELAYDTPQQTKWIVDPETGQLIEVPFDFQPRGSNLAMY